MTTTNCAGYLAQCIYGRSTSFATARLTSYGFDTSTYPIGVKKVSTLYYVYRILFLVDTSSIPDTDIISSAIFTIDTSLIPGAYAPYGDIRAYDFSSLSFPTDREVAYDGVNGASDIATINNIATYSTKSVWNYNNMSNLSWINKASYSLFGLVSSDDEYNQSPAGNGTVTFNSISLLVTHAPPATFIPHACIL